MKQSDYVFVAVIFTVLVAVYVFDQYIKRKNQP